MNQQAREVLDYEQFLTFVLGGEEYGIGIREVAGIQGESNTRSIPGSPEYVRGVIDLRDEVVPIVDLKIRFGEADRTYGERVVFILVSVPDGGNTRTIGLIVDDVADVLNVNINEIKMIPDFGELINESFIKGCSSVGERLVIFLDVEKLMIWEEVPQVEVDPQFSEEENLA